MPGVLIHGVRLFRHAARRKRERRYGCSTADRLRLGRASRVDDDGRRRPEQVPVLLFMRSYLPFDRSPSILLGNKSPPADI
ncbi:MAG: hypothetical protein WKF30_00230 [Pyrinomonadaceae bacterium]